jgi:putative DNA primase/helicase
MLGVVHDAATMLDGRVDSTLVIGEGLETVLAARQLGFMPAWALGSVGAIGRFPLVQGIKVLRILGEEGDVSRVMVQRCAKRWAIGDRRVGVIMPDAGLSDMNDVLLAVSGTGALGWYESYRSEPVRPAAQTAAQRRSA